MKRKANPILTRTSLYTIGLVVMLFALLPLSQMMLDGIDNDMVTVRRVDTTPPPPPPPVQLENVEASGASQFGVNLQSLVSAVNIEPISTDVVSSLSGSVELGLNGVDFGVTTQANFTMKGVGFGTIGLDRPPIMLVKPTLRSGYMKRNGIDQFDVVVMVKWLSDGNLTFISIEEIEYPDIELAILVRDAVARIRYTKPSVNGKPVERFIRLPLTIHAE